MISAGDFRNGITLEIDGNVYQIMEFQHVKPGKGAAFVRTKIKDVVNGGVVERTFLQRSSRRPELTVWTCSIYMRMAIFITLWIRTLTSRSH